MNWLRVKQCIILAIPGAIAGALLMFLLLTFSDEVFGIPPRDLDYLGLVIGLQCCGGPLVGAGGVIALWLLYQRRQGPPPTQQK